MPSAGGGLRAVRNRNPQSGLRMEARISPVDDDASRPEIGKQKHFFSSGLPPRIRVTVCQSVWDFFDGTPYHRRVRIPTPTSGPIWSNTKHALIVPARVLVGSKYSNVPSQQTLPNRSHPPSRRPDFSQSFMHQGRFLVVVTIFAARQVHL